MIEGFKKLEKAAIHKEGSIEAMIEEKVSHYLQEQSERSSRQCNLIIHNVPEACLFSATLMGSIRILIL